MTCNEIRDLLVDVAGGAEIPSGVQNHLHICAECTNTLDELRKTMALLNEWQAPEPSPYFDVRLQARLREEKQKAAASWLDWLRKPVLGLVAVVLVAAGVGLFEYDHTPNPSQEGHLQIGSAVGDLQFLDRNSDILQNFDALDALDGAPDSAPAMN